MRSLLLILCTVILASWMASGTVDAQSAVPQAATKLGSVKLIRANGFDDFVKQLNDQGKNGYKLVKSVSSGEEGASQSFAAVLRLDPGNTYEYDWMSSPNKNLLETRLNSRASYGFSFVNAFPLTSCGGDDSEGNSKSEALVLRLKKGDAFLLERSDRSSDPAKEYKVVIGKIGLGKSPTEAIQTSLNNSPAGFRPAKILFSKTGVTDFAISVLLEKDLNVTNSPKIEYRFVKEVNGFEKSLNSLAAQGFRILSGRRIGLVKMALMAKETSAPVVYTLVDEEKYAKQFDETVNRGNRFEDIFAGDVDCGSSRRVNEKLIFTQNSTERKYDYRIIPVSDSVDADVERLLVEGFSIRDIFFYQGLKVIFEK